MHRAARLSLMLVPASLVVLAAGCGGSTEASVSTTPASTGSTAVAPGAGSTRTLTYADGSSYTVTLAPGITQPVDVFGNGGAEPIAIRSASGGDALTVKPDQLFALGLAENPSTGYVWTQTGGTALGTVVTPIQDQFAPTSKDPGSPGEHLFVYRGADPGTGTVTFAQRGPGSKSDAKTQTFTVTVTG